MSTPPIDRGWAWMCVLGAAVCNFLFTGSLRAIGIIILEVMEEFNCSAAVTGVMLGLMSGFISVFSPILNSLSVRYTYRKVVMVGAFVFVTAYLLLSVSPTVHCAVLSIGVFGGIGMCSLFGPPLVVVGQYFNERRSFANGLTTAGGSLGQLSLPIFTRYLFDIYGFTGAFIVFGAFALHAIPAAALFRPFSFYTSRGKSNCVEMKLKPCDKSVPSIVTEDIETKQEPGRTNGATAISKSQDAYINNFDHNPTKGQESQLLMHSKSEYTGLSDSKHSLHLSKTRVSQLRKSTSHSSLKQWMGSVSSLNPLKHKQSLYASTASLSVLEYQKPPIDALKQEQQKFEAHQSLTNISTSKFPKEEQELISSTKDEALATFCCICTTVPSHTTPWLEWSLFRNYMFVMYVFGMCMGNTGVVNCCIYLPPRAMDIGVDKQRAALLLSIVGACDFVGRIFGGWFADLGYIKRYKIMTGTLIITGVTSLICNHIESYTSFMILACVLGFIGGTYIALFVVLLVDFVGLEKLPSASGLAIMCLGLFNVPMPTIMGAMKDSTGSFQTAYTMMGCLTILAGLCYALEPIGRKLENNKANRRKFKVDNPIYKPCTTAKY